MIKQLSSLRIFSIFSYLILCLFTSPVFADNSLFTTVTTVKGDCIPQGSGSTVTCENQNQNTDASKSTNVKGNQQKSIKKKKKYTKHQRDLKAKRQKESLNKNKPSFWPTLFGE